MQGEQDGNLRWQASKRRFQEKIEENWATVKGRNVEEEWTFFKVCCSEDCERSMWVKKGETMEVRVGLWRGVVE